MPKRILYFLHSVSIYVVGTNRVFNRRRPNEKQQILLVQIAGSALLKTVSGLFACQLLLPPVAQIWRLRLVGREG